MPREDRTEIRWNFCRHIGGSLCWVWSWFLCYPLKLGLYGASLFGSSACMTITSPALPWEHLEWYDWSTWILGFQTNIWIVEELHLLLLWSVLFGVYMLLRSFRTQDGIFPTWQLCFCSLCVCKRIVHCYDGIPVFMKVNPIFCLTEM